MFDRHERIPSNLDRLEPGPELAAFLLTIDVHELSGHDRIVVLRAHQRMVSHYQARLLEDMASVVDVINEGDVEVAIESAAAEVRAALRLTRRAADAQVSFALELRERLPAVWELLAVGAIDLRRARVMSEGTGHLSAETARDVANKVLEDAIGLTTGQLAARLRRMCIDADPDDAAERYGMAVDERRVIVEPSVFGTAHLLGLDLPPDRVTAIMAKINYLAKSLRRTGEARTMDQLRADVLLDLLDRKELGSGGTVEVRVDLDTLAHLNDHAGELAGYGPIIAEIARNVTDRSLDGCWRYVVTEAVSGAAVDTGTLRRRPTAGQRRAVEVSQKTCIFPGCRMPATDCDLDHRLPYAEGGPTNTANLVPLCRHDHRIRHSAGWIHEPLPDGDHLWTTKLGHTYTTTGRSP